MSNMFRGTGVALVTPFKEDLSIDFDALAKLIDHVIDNGVNYLVALGTTAETPTLTDEEKKQILAFVIKHNNNRVPVVCGMGGNNTAEIVNQLKTYDLNGVAGILTVAPYYNKPSQEGMYQHFKAIAEATKLPIILYNVPGRTASNILPATALRIANEFAHVIAIKEASGNLVQCMELVQNKPAHFAILSGDDNLVLPQIAIGMEGVISVAANSYPKDFTNMVNAALAGNFNESRALHYKLLKGIDLLFAEGNPVGVKCALNLMNICKNTLRLPLVTATAGLQQNTKEFVDTLKG
ncbi:4-hydroxy-tetrahydrodipicolinate synthase [Taibaiella soli]|uniref:4-hydroxy-tetrahydrodipicolinate synthase n=1 Tax=Taibaiella soli TaxID=1649169 RepID=A0A2W2BW71_9BACT|nr:4-hydroxy-tetrahydrodipicolinate synthase [Taibaiella soli]PZF72093.1 4-hydroxy-tetrahydrodipicolinate synthase [Taibaiella soli]